MNPNIQRFVDVMRGSMIGRDEEIRTITLALIAREHCCLVGDPGTGKSYAVNNAIKAMGAKSFQLLMTVFTTPEEVFGPFRLTALQQDQYIRNLTGRACEAEVFFADEIYKSSSAILNALLTMMQERAYDNGGSRVKCPLRSLIPEHVDQTFHVLDPNCVCPVEVSRSLGDVDRLACSAIADLDPAGLKQIPNLLESVQRVSSHGQRHCLGVGLVEVRHSADRRHTGKAPGQAMVKVQSMVEQCADLKQTPKCLAIAEAAQDMSDRITSQQSGQSIETIRRLRKMTERRRQELASV